MRIPLDYYRILGLPIQATAEQLKQSHRDRMLQVPRREYSELAIDARRQLIDVAYSVLGNSMRRSEYDQAFLAASKPAMSVTADADFDDNVPTIEMENHQLVGALLILLELGEYELVLRLGRPYLQRDSHTPEGRLLKEQPALADIILTLAIACLELGREEWQQNHYEHAAESLETGRELLIKEDLFPVLRAEVQADLYKLRPYRTLELIARPLEQKRSRKEGIALLRGMLQDRGGIDGAEDDLSGLGVDDFLRFVQQLRGFLTAAEQQEVFEAEAQRPSAVGTYLAVYALLARGFAQHQPTLIRRAKQMLLRLSGRQDVHLEQAICAVLLGQTEEASRALERSQEYDPLDFIREHSQGSPDLLPGLCLYAENWLQQEVFPFFRDLDQQPATLKDYFADSSVQSYLENLPLENERTNRQTLASLGIGTAKSATTLAGEGYADIASKPFSSLPLGQSVANQLATSQSVSSQLASSQLATSQTSHPTPSSQTANSPTASSQSADSQSVSQSTYESDSILGKSTLSRRFDAAQSRLTGAVGLAGAANITERISQMSPAGQLSHNEADEPDDFVASTSASPRDRRSRRYSPKWGRVGLVILAGVLCLGLAAILVKLGFSLVYGTASNSSGVDDEPLDLTINQPVIQLEASENTAATIPATDAAGIAEATLNQWLEIKRAAYANTPDASELKNILTGPSLDFFEDDVQSAQARNWYINYAHDNVKILSVEPEDASDTDTLSVEAQVSESAEFYQGSQRVDQYSFPNDVVTIRYSLVRRDEQWLIEDSEVIESF